MDRTGLEFHFVFAKCVEVNQEIQAMAAERQDLFFDTVMSVTLPHGVSNFARSRFGTVLVFFIRKRYDSSDTRVASVTFVGRASIGHVMGR